MPAAAEAEADADRDRGRIDSVAGRVIAGAIAIAGSIAVSDRRRGRGDDAAAEAGQHERDRSRAVKPCHVQLLRRPSAFIGLAVIRRRPPRHPLAKPKKMLRPRHAIERRLWLKASPPTGS